MDTDQAHLISLASEFSQKHQQTQFQGYNSLDTAATVIGLSDGHSKIDSLIRLNLTTMEMKFIEKKF